MKKVSTLVIYQLKNIRNDWKTLVFTFFIALGILGCIGYFFASVTQPKQFVEPFNVAIVNYDQALETRIIVQQFKNSKQIKDLVNLIESDEMTAMEMLEKNQLASVIIIPDAFSNDISEGKNTPVLMIGNRQRPLQSLLIKTVMESFANNVTAAQSGVNTVYYFLKKINAPTRVLQMELQNSILKFSLNSLGRKEFFIEEKIDDPAIKNPVHYYFLSSLIILIEIWTLMLMSIFAGTRHVLLEQRILLFGVKQVAIIFSNLVVLSSILFLQTSIVFVAVLSFDQYNLKTIFAIGLISWAVSTFFVFLDAIVLNKTMFNLFGLSTVIILAFIGGGIVPLSYLPPIFEQMSFISINKWALDLFLLSSEDIIALLPLANLTLITVICFILATLFHVRWVKKDYDS